MSAARLKSIDSIGLYEPSLTIQHIPRCPSCGASRAVGTQDCVECGIPLPPLPSAQEITPVLTSRDPSIVAGRGLLALGRLFARLRRSL